MQDQNIHLANCPLTKKVNFLKMLYHMDGQNMF